MAHFKGIILSKTKVKEKDLILKILLENGTHMDVMAYGALSSNKKKANILEIGYAINFNIDKKGFKQSDLRILREPQIHWSYSKLRENHIAFYLVCLFLEIAAKVSPKADDSELGLGDVYSGLYKILSNGIFYVEESSKNNQFDQWKLLSLFLGKTLFYLGVFPDYTHCMYCNVGLDGMGAMLMDSEGGFSCLDCLSQKENFTIKHREVSLLSEVRNLLHHSKILSFKQYESAPNSSHQANLRLVKYLCFQFNLSENNLKSLNMIF